MLGSKNTWNSGKFSPALPLQHCNLKFFDIFEIGVTEGLERKWVSGMLYPAYFSRKLARGFPALYRRRKRRFLKQKMSF